MLQYPQFDPILIGIGPVQIRWYGLMYVLGFTASYLLVRRRLERDASLAGFATHFENLNFVLILSLVLGGRLGYVLFYNLPYYLSHPGEILATWMGGMSFHGAAIGTALGGALYCRLKGLDFWRGADLYVVTMPIGLGLGRIGNFINAELYGRVTDVPWAMVFPGGGPLPRHPSQLYECLLEGVLLFTLLWRLKDRRWPSGSMLAAFFGFYGLFRILVEFVREPDPQLGFLPGGVTMGQILSGLMITAGVLIAVLRRRAARSAP